MKRVWALSGLLITGLAPACCGVSAKFVQFGGQQNLILWDESTKMQHFVRIAGFSSSSKDLGFLAPTPTIPKLAEVDAKVFNHLQGLRPIPARLTESKSEDDTAAVPGGVAVVAQTEVAGYVATTFEASDTNALREYLKRYGFRLTDPQAEWMDLYVKKRWMITAFQVKVANGYGQTRPVRMTFQTDQPYNPYYVPTDNIPKHPAGVRIYFISKGIYDSYLESKRPLEVYREFTTDIPDADRKIVADYLKLDVSEVGNALSLDSIDAFPERGVKEDLFFRLVSAEVPRMEEDEIRLRDMDPRRMEEMNAKRDAAIWTGAGIGIGVGGGFLAWALLRRRSARGARSRF